LVKSGDTAFILWYAQDTVCHHQTLSYSIFD